MRVIELIFGRRIMFLPMFAIAAVISAHEPAFAQSDADVTQCRDGRSVIALAACTRLIERNVGDSELYNAFINRGNLHFFMREHSNAIIDYTDAIARWPMYTASYVNRAAVYFETGDFDRAIADYNHVINTTPEFAGAYSGRARAFEAKGAIDLAIADHKKAVELEPGNLIFRELLRRLVP